MVLKQLSVTVVTLSRWVVSENSKACLFNATENEANRKASVEIKKVKRCKVFTEQ